MGGSDGGRGILRANFASVVNALLAAAQRSPKWRDRESGVAAIGDLIGYACAPMTWQQLGGWLGHIWQCVLLALDDVKDSVKAAAVRTAKTALSLTARFVDSGVSRRRDVRQAVKRLLPLLLRAPIEGPPSAEGDFCALGVQFAHDAE